MFFCSFLCRKLVVMCTVSVCSTDKCLGKLVNMPMTESEDVSTHEPSDSPLKLPPHHPPSPILPPLPSLSPPLSPPPSSTSICQQALFCAYLDECPSFQAQELLVMHYAAHNRYGDAVIQQSKIRPLAMVRILSYPFLWYFNWNKAPLITSCTVIQFNYCRWTRFQEPRRGLCSVTDS